METQINGQEWVDKDLYPFKTLSIQLTSGRMNYVDEGHGDILLFVHGTPTWSFLYREFIKKLSSGYRCIAIDHIGFGLSEKSESFGGRPEQHADNLSEFIQKLDLNNVTLVVHDFGGPIGLGAGLKTPDRIEQVVLFNSWLWETKNDPDALKIDKLINGWMGRSLYLSFNFSPKVLLKKGFSNKKNLPKSAHKHYINPFPNKTSRIPLLNLAKALVGSSDWYDLQWKNLGLLEEKDWLILWGMKDEFITTTYLERWKERLPNAQVHEFSCGHFVQEEKTHEAIDQIKSFLEN